MRVHFEGDGSRRDFKILEEIIVDEGIRDCKISEETIVDEGGRDLG